MKIRVLNKFVSLECSCNLFDLVGSECVADTIMQSVWPQNSPGQVFPLILSLSHDCDHVFSD